ncbi:MAG: FAD-dependent oxidoreductase [Terriglobales bacterium]|jgi:NADPH-dependent glutamate synthase beta subunit-like oxidoreductase/ferredoxin
MQRRFLDKRVDEDWLHTNFPCMMACPAHTNAGRYVGLIAEGRFEEAYQYARSPNPLASICGRVCDHPCETACRRGQIDKPVSIRALKRFLTQRFGPESNYHIDVNAGAVSQKLPFKVAVVGGGPVGLSAAHDLALMGYSVTIFEAAPVAGGMLYLGIPEYRLPRDVVEAQVREILATGDITLKLNQQAGRDFQIADLRQQGFDAILLAIGAHRSRDLTIPGADLDGVHRGVDFLLNVNLGHKFTIGRNVLVIGGSNVAMHVARSAAREAPRQHAGGIEELAPSEENIAAVAIREMLDISLSALRMGAQQVHTVFLEKRDDMLAALEEIEEAETEGVILHLGFGAKGFIGKDGRVTAIECLKTKSVFDENRRFNPTFFENSDTEIVCDTVIMAIGRTTNLDFLRPGDGVEVSPRGLINVSPHSLMTSAPGIFAGGECVFGPRLIIDSVGDGKRAAMGIDSYLRGAQHPRPIVEITKLERHAMPQESMDLVRQPIPMLPVDRRTGMSEVEECYDEVTAVTEAQRCLHCWVNTVFEGYADDATQCTLCGDCVDVCPENCLELVPLDRVQFDVETINHISDNRSLYEAELTDIAPEQLNEGVGSVMLKDETRCIRCGLCAASCPAHTITMESYNLLPAEPNGLISAEAIEIPLRAKAAATAAQR